MMLRVYFFCFVGKLAGLDGLVGWMCWGWGEPPKYTLET